MQGNDLLSIKGEAGSAVMLVMWESANQLSVNSAVAFHRDGNQYSPAGGSYGGNQAFLWSGESKAERRASLRRCRQPEFGSP